MYFCIDMKCFFASVECAERGLNPLTTPLVVADAARGKGALCLAVSPYLKQQGVKNRGRLFEIPKHFQYIIAKPRMKKYIEYAVRIHRIFLKYVSAEDIHTYSIDEAFLCITPYLNLYTSPFQMAQCILQDIKEELGIIAACGAGENLFLAKISLDLKAKYSENNFYFLNRTEFFQSIWFHSPLTDIWQIGKRIAKRLNQMRIYNLHDLALANKEDLIKEFGVNGGDLYDYAWVVDPTTIEDIKSYEPQSRSYSRNQILFRDYTKEEAWVPLLEMLFSLCMELYHNQIVMNALSFYIGYSGRKKREHQTIYLSSFTSDFFKIKEVLKKEYFLIEDGSIRQIGITMLHLADADTMHSLFDFTEKENKELYHSIDTIWQKYGKNALVIGTALKEESTLYKRNQQIGGHNSDG